MNFKNVNVDADIDIEIDNDFDKKNKVLEELHSVYKDKSNKDLKSNYDIDSFLSVELSFSVLKNKTLPIDSDLRTVDFYESYINKFKESFKVDFYEHYSKNYKKDEKNFLQDFMKKFNEDFNVKFCDDFIITDKVKKLKEREKSLGYSYKKKQ